MAAILIFKMSDQQRTILEVIFRILMLKNMGVDEMDGHKCAMVARDFCILGTPMNILV